MARPQRFFDQSQPQTLQIATILLYLNAAFLVLGLAFFSPIGLLLLAGYGGGAFGMANGKKWGYGLAIGGAGFRLLLLLTGSSLGAVIRSTGGIVELMFSVALLALLLHPQSREYQKIWFS